MNIVWGVVVLVVSVVCWVGQLVSWWAPHRAASLGLMESEADVEPTYFADIRGEAVWDSLTLWAFVVAAVLLIADQPLWPYFGLVGGGMFVYFGGRAIFTRAAMLRRGLRIGTPQNVKTAYVFMSVTVVVALITIAAAVAALAGE